MATVPRRGNFTRRKRRFSYVEKYEPSDRPMTPGDETEDYSSADEVDIDDVDHPKILLAARDEEENRALAEKAARKSLQDEAQKKTAKAKVLTVARAVANVISPGKKVTIKLKRRGESGGGRGPKKYTKKQVKAHSRNKQQKYTKRQPKRRD
uniref:Uncharacterized protein n=1 Tax=viral metagenome TaxID=1070528 RepID=A0A6C0AJL7_9ZZZZ